MFRDFTPKRRTLQKNYKKYQRYKNDLKKDFASRCGYCNSSDSLKITYYEVDHFIPVFILKKKTETDYSNLVYSCRSCNNAKRKHWPTNNEDIPNENNQGFVDPCDDDYNTHFKRDKDGKIVPITLLGEWMYTTLKLYKPQHEILWNIEQLKILIDKLKTISNVLNEHPGIKDSLLKLYERYTEYIEKFKAL